MNHVVRTLLSTTLLVALNVGCGSGESTSTTTTTVKQETLVWADEFNGATAASAPNPLNWTFDTGAGGWGNQELETYCAYGSTSAPCDAAAPNSFVGTDGYLHIVARADAKGNYTSARLKTQGLQSFQYGRIEASIKLPATQGMWPAFWMLGDNITTVGWPACGELDIMENLGKEPSIAHASVHGTKLDGTLPYTLPGGAKFSDAFHIFGLIWAPGKVQYYIDNPTNIYATFTNHGLATGAVWPFDTAKFFFILNVAVGGSWPGAPDATTAFPQEMLVDYVRVYAEPGTTTSAFGKEVPKVRK